MELQDHAATTATVIVAIIGRDVLSREEAYMIASIAVDYHVTQAVDGTRGIHGMIPKSIFTAQ